MFLRRKAPQLSVLEELQQTYNDVCNTTVKNLDLEDRGQFEEALKGWKALHTLLLYKIDMFEKKPSKIHLDEAKILSELGAIRDENVKHLVRIQLRLDEQRRQGKKPDAPAPLPLPLHNMSIPLLRNGGSAPRSHTSQHRHMMKSLRPGVPSVKLLALNRDAVKQAAAILWPKLNPKPKSKDLFDDFDQTEMSPSNWERLNTGGLTSTDLSESLIDLDDDMSKSAEDIVKKKTPPPPPPKSRLLKPEQPDKEKPRTPIQRDKSPEKLLYFDKQLLHISLDKLFPNLSLEKPQLHSPYQSSRLTSSPEMTKPTIRQVSKSTPDVRPKTYTYTQPAPINVKKMMEASNSRSKVRAKNPATREVHRSNITYNYKIVEKPKPKVKPPVRPKPVQRTALLVPPSPTMDDILGGYDSVEADIPQVVVEAPNSDDGMDKAEQEALIQSIRGIDELAATQILNDIVVRGDEVYWDDIVGLESAKNLLKEAVVYPFLRPDLFRGLREPTRGMLLFGPPGTGKTMLARAVATESKSTFFLISLSSLTSKYLGESEKLVKALFLLARKLSPSIVFIDEIDSLLGTRTEGEIESMRRIKNEFLVQWSELSSAAAGRDTSGGDVSRVLILGATNLPWGIDDAARRRFAKRVYIPLPEDETRRLQISKLLAYQKNTLLEKDYDKLVELTKGFSGSDITLLAKDSAMGPLRLLGDKLLSTPTDQIRPIQLEDFVESLKYIRPSVSQEGLVEYENWAAKFGSSGA